MAASVAGLVRPELSLELAFDPAAPSLVDAFASLFLHTGVLHLLGNLVFLAAVGPLVESVAGWWRYGVTYVVAGLAGSGVHWSVAALTGGGLPTLGASGAIAGVVGFAAVRFARKRVPLAPGFTAPVAAVVAVWIALQAIGAFVSVGQPTVGVAFWAHLGGFLAGLVLAAVFGANRQAAIVEAHETVERMESRSPAARIAAADLALERDPRDKKALVALVEAAALTGDSDREADALVTLIRTGDLARVDRLLELGEAHRMDAVERLRLAERVEGPAALAVLESVARDARAGKRQADAVIALVELTRESDPETSAAWLRELVETHGSSEAAQIARAKGWIE